MRKVNRRWSMFAIVSGVAASLALAGFLARRSAAPRLAGDSTSEITFDVSEWDFGVVDPEKPLLAHTFQLTNHGGSPVNIEPTYLGCNCLSVECPEQVAPRATASVRVELEVRRREGPFSTRVGLTTNATGARNLELRLAFYGQPTLDVDPPAMQFAGASHEGVLERELTVVTRLESSSATPDVPAPTIEIAPSFRSIITVGHIETKPTAGLLANRGGDGFARLAHRYLVSIDARELPMEPDVAMHDALRVSATTAGR
ncbi:MAG: DUF1573 domain-containing protein, partial [Candidatus Saccharimonadales bacterium]